MTHEIDPLLGRPLSLRHRAADGRGVRPVLSHPLRRDGRGKKIIEKALDVAQLGLRENWNHGKTDDPHIGCVMLAPDLLPFLGVFALLESGCHEVWLTKSRQVVGIEADDEPDQSSIETLLRRRTGTDALRTPGRQATAIST